MDKDGSIWGHRVYAGLLAILSSVLWGSAFPVVKWTYAELDIAPGATFHQIYLAGVRFCLAGAFVLLFSRYRLKQSLRIRCEVVSSLVLLGVLQTSLQYFFFYSGLAHTTGVKSAIMTSVGTFLVVLVAHFLYADDRMNWGKAIGLATGFTGVVLVNWQTVATGFSWDFAWRGEGFLLLASIASVIGTFQAKQLAGSIHPVVMNGWQLLLGSLLLLVVGVQGMGGERLAFTPLAWALLLYSAFLSAAAFSIWYTLLKHNKAGEVSMYRFMIPVSGAMLSAAFVPEEDLTWSILMALGLVAAGIVAVNRSGIQVNRPASNSR